MNLLRFSTSGILKAVGARRLGTLKIAPVQCETEKPSIQVPLTSDSYKHYKRDSKFSKVTPEDVQYFKQLLPTESVLVVDGAHTTEDDLIPYNQDWFKCYRGQSQVVLKPHSTEQVAKLLSYCNAKRLAVVPQGGNTGASGGSVPIFDEIIVNTSNLNRIRKFDPLSGVVLCESGCILEHLDNYLAERGYIVPLDLGSKGSCQIGGNVSTNAGGIRLLRYGSLHGNILGLEVVLADGTIVDGLSALRKDNTGYDIKQLFIGSEGTLGIVTGVSLLTPKRPKFTNVALVGMQSFQSVQHAYSRAKEHLSEVLSAYEFWDARSLHYGRTLGSKKFRVPFGSEYPFYVLVETSGSNNDHDSEKLGCFLEGLLESNIIDDGVVAQDRTQYKNLWAIRESLGEACGAPVPIYKYDISLPVPVLYDIVEDLRSRLAEKKLLGPNGPVSDVVGFGHIGDGNLHLTIFAKEFTPEAKSLIEPYVYEWTSRYNGSIAAEHGLGIKNSDYIGYSKSAPMVSMMRRIKNALDPNGIMNPYKVFPTAFPPLSHRLANQH
ncbi:D-lactate dehydrogenase 2 [Basidiobolus meristosporus CBS 931.73]|uniref:D-lactate dehydrogenase (cytochrome) n=1 Tax=Basidiobolus meristosporus CBS 931.73 TaxID=1314790 RepID=A0A1Y1YMD6_9FUNG|nr:D-lactate dehydrogenase 2 [Basidiobolus meristosporus CBS 931.73]|eukprot:ORX99180.1 D-lactate dehydrogenase 2 [Basidiobolus meristosporus CBS 931.73]